ncbi:MAG: M1 family metallopeptidase [Saprospiraceae bacterium]|nr:M1 family metallopeptidase [Saprospiraceae bacterium]
MRLTTWRTNSTRLPLMHLVKASLLLWVILLDSSMGIAQRPQYRIHATLDTAVHIVSGKIDITYTNHASVALDKLGIHLWPNAYSTKESALAKQMVNLNNFDLHKARAADMGGLAGLRFTTAEQPIQLKTDPEFIDIAWLILDSPLQPGDSIQVSSPFQLTIPKSFSRMGHAGNSFQLTQWYPHIGVFDEEGWHMMAYLDQGEFFNDFADYDVHVEVPPGYTVAATGVLNSKTTEDRMVDWHFQAENVIDFAWFTSPAFRHEKYTGVVAGQNKVDLNVYYDPRDSVLWNRAGEYAARALEFYSDWLGAYPYPQMSVVSAPLSAGGGMEYPMVAQIGYMGDSASLDLVIAHEIGHTWLYGILANNERAHPWMDEGLNSFIEAQYTAKYQPAYREAYLPREYTTRASMDQVDALQHALHFSNTLQPPATAPEAQQQAQYFFSAYTMPAQGLQMMMGMEGEEVMKKMFRQYFADHQFSHVTPAQLSNSFEQACGCDLSWFFDGWIHHAHEIDYRISHFDKEKKEVTFVNYGPADIPLRFNTYKDGQQIREHTLNGFKGEKTIHLDHRADEIHLYEGFMGVNRHWSSNINPRSVIPRFGFMPKIESYRSPTISITPAFGYNLADGFMAGVALSSGLLPQQHFKFVVAPLYAKKSKKIRGYANFRYINDLKSGPFDKFLLSLAFDDFGYNLDTHYLFRDHYFRWEPTVAFRLKPTDTNAQISQWLKYRYVNIDQYYGRGQNYEDKIFTEEHRSYGIHELSYQFRSDEVLKPLEAIGNVQAGKGFVRLNLRYKQHFVGKDKRRGVWVQAYGGWLPVYDSPDAAVGFTINGMASSGYFSRDYMFDQWLGGRNAESGIFSHQVYEKDAGLKTLSTIGIGDKWMIGGGASVALPFKWVHLYMDMALYDSAITEKTALSYSGGFSIVLVKDVFEIFVPLFESKDIRESLSYTVRDVWYERISFKASIKLGEPLNLIDREQLRY